MDTAALAVQQAQDALAQVELVAPFDSIVQDVTAQQGATVGAGIEIVKLLDPSALQVRSTVTEQDYPLIHTGENVTHYFDAQPELAAQGTVARLVPLRDSSSTSPVYPIYITPDKIPAGLAPGMTVDASVAIERRADVLYLPRALVHSRADGLAQVRGVNLRVGEGEFAVDVFQRAKQHRTRHGGVGPRGVGAARVSPTKRIVRR